MARPPLAPHAAGAAGCCWLRCALTPPQQCRPSRLDRSMAAMGTLLKRRGRRWEDLCAVLCGVAPQQQGPLTQLLAERARKRRGRVCAHQAPHLAPVAGALPSLLRIAFLPLAASQPCRPCCCWRAPPAYSARQPATPAPAACWGLRAAREPLAHAGAAGAAAAAANSMRATPHAAPAPGACTCGSSVRRHAGGPSPPAPHQARQTRSPRSRAEQQQRSSSRAAAAEQQQTRSLSAQRQPLARRVVRSSSQGRYANR